MSIVMFDYRINIFAGLERKYLLKESRKGIPRDNVKNADPEPDDGDSYNDNDGDDGNKTGFTLDGDDAAEITKPKAGDNILAD